MRGSGVVVAEGRNNGGRSRKRKPPDTTRVLEFYERIAPRYDRSNRFWERVFRMEPGRQWLAREARGRVLEIGIGTGRNLPNYREDVHVTGIELSPCMLQIARTCAVDCRAPVELMVGDATALPFPDGSFDTVVFCLTLCTIPDDRGAVKEAVRALRPGGQMLLLEHVRSSNPVVRIGQRALEPISLRLEADHLTREPLELLRDAGLVIEHPERWALGIMERVRATKLP